MRATPARNCRLQPPVFHFGWVLDLNKCRAMATERQLARLRLDDDSDQSSDDSDDADSDEDEDEDEYAFWEAYAAADESLPQNVRVSIEESIKIRACKELTEEVMEKFGLDSGNDEFVQPVLATLASEPNSSLQLALCLGDNYHLDELPNAELLAKIKEEFCFDCDAGWFMDGLETSWVRR